MEISVFATIILTLTQTIECRYCIKEVTFDYGYGFYIKCDGLTDQDEERFKNLYATEDTVLELRDSNLANFAIRTFKNFNNIRGLIVDNTTMNLQFFHNLKSIQYLNVTDSRIRLNQIDFPLLPTLKKLILNNIDLGTFDATKAEKFNNLEIVDLNRNQLVAVANLTNLKELTIFRASHNNLTKLNKHDFISSDNYRKNKIKRLFFDYNQIQEVDVGIFKILQNLEEINLNYNHLSKIEFVNLTKLQIIRLGNNELIRVELKNLTNLRELSLNNNLINNLDNWRFLPNLKLLKLNQNSLTKIDRLSEFANLRVLDLSSNLVDLHNNLFINLTNLEELYLSDNQFKQLPEDLFKNQKNLTILDLSFNRLDSINNQTFSNLNNLITLNLSHNSLNNLNYDSIKFLKKIEILELTGNRLTNFEYNPILTRLPTLTIMDIKSNLLSCNLLEDMLVFLKARNASFTLNENLDYNQKNVAGVTCVELQQNSRPFTIVLIIVLLICLIFTCYLVMRATIYYFKRRNYVLNDLELV